MSETHLDVWRKNLEGKIKEIQSICSSFCTTETPTNMKVKDFRNDQRQGIHRELENLKKMFSLDQVPHQIPRLKNACDHFYSNRFNDQAFRGFLASADDLSKITDGMHKVISFHDIFDAYRSDEALNELVDRLIDTLQNVLNEGNEHLNSRIERELQRIIDQLKERSKYSLYELAAWVEIAGRFAAEVIGQKQGIPGLSLLVDAAKLAKQIGNKVVNAHRDASVEAIRLLEVKTIEIIPSESIPLTEDELHRLETMAFPNTISSAANQAINSGQSSQV